MNRDCDPPSDLPLVAVTPGDPAGVGPEVIAGAWPDENLHRRCTPLVVGHPELLRRAVRVMGVSCEVVEIERPAEARPDPGRIPCLACGPAEILEIRPATLDARGGQAAYECLAIATELALTGEVDAITTGPLSKAALWRAGHHYPGHTELLAEMCGAGEVAMMLYLPPGPGVGGEAGLGVVHVTLHLALRDVFTELSAGSILARCHLAHRALRTLKGSPPRIGVAALNPHAGEEGLFGDEETTQIGPAVSQAQADGLDIEGPLPVDTLMVRAAAGEFDAVVAMYHDQGHIALKLLGLHRAVNVTLGLPIIRTSVAHGTAFDRAWQGTADPRGMRAALRVAADLVARGLAVRASPELEVRGG